MTALEQMIDLRRRSDTTLRQMIDFSAEMLRLGVLHIQEKLAEFTTVIPVTRSLIATLDAHDSAASNDRQLDAFRTRWPDLQVSEIVFDRTNNKFLIFTL